MMIHWLIFQDLLLIYILTHYDPDTVSENLKETDYSGAWEAAADKLNKIIGHDFDPSTVQFHFEASSGDLLK